MTAQVLFFDIFSEKGPHLNAVENDDILITDYAKVSISVITQCVTKNFKIANIATVLDEAALYDRFNTQGTVSHVFDIDNHERDGNMMAVRTVVVQD